MNGPPANTPEGACWKPRWELAVLLSCGLLGWELVLLELLSGGFDVRASTVGRLLAKDAALLVPLWTLVVAGVRVYRHRHPGPLTDARKAALLSTSFLLLLLPVAAGRGIVQSRPAPSTPSDMGLARPATADPLTDESRFLCSVASPDLSSPEEPGDDSLLDAAWAGIRDAMLLQVPVFPLTWLLVHHRSRFALTRARGSATASLLWLGAACLWKSDEGPVLEADVCPPGAPVRHYAVAAIATDIRLNAEGDHIPRGLRYVLDGERTEGPEVLPYPLVLRANLGECLRLRFTNRLDQEPAALHIEGLRGTVSGPGRTGDFVPGTSLPPGQSLTYALALPDDPEAEGAYLLHDPEDGGERESRGLFGALVLEPAGARYRDASENGPLPGGQGWEARIDTPSGSSFRELVLISHAMGPPEVAEVRSSRGELLPELDEMAGPFRAGSFGLNYRSHPQFERDEPHASPPEAEAPLLRSYRDEAIKLRVVHAGNAEPHIPHVHGWSESSDEPLAQPHLLTPGGSLTLVLTEDSEEHRAAGDFVVHCHAPNHTSGGERVIWRVFDRPQPHLTAP
ncbi:multicopper oxidase domain-containing protein [Melittangium boletus]|uniref:Plastocyanin-like domain-containing protein n=1 Tax=Melittangium boletus DSM 14713 TaxID=1294270 RepID=A0A250IPL5_9BACT|nr:multicopper oxidase domain-containing protein [Melittangium boletus]ATB33182.1 hypothetical protein MEBOL_006671 [Melittangium boletus DSM 14713]